MSSFIKFYIIATWNHRFRAWYYHLHEQSDAESLNWIRDYLRPTNPPRAAPGVFANVRFFIIVNRGHLPEPAPSGYIDYSLMRNLASRTPHIEVYFGQFSTTSLPSSGRLGIWSTVFQAVPASNGSFSGTIPAGGGSSSGAFMLRVSAAPICHASIGPVRRQLEEELRSAMGFTIRGLDMVEMLMDKWETFLNDPDKSVFRLAPDALAWL